MRQVCVGSNVCKQRPDTVEGTEAMRAEAEEMRPRVTGAAWEHKAVKWLWWSNGNEGSLTTGRGIYQQISHSNAVSHSHVLEPNDTRITLVMCGGNVAQVLTLQGRRQQAEESLPDSEMWQWKLLLTETCWPEEHWATDQEELPAIFFYYNNSQQVQNRPDPSQKRRKTWKWLRRTCLRYTSVIGWSSV